MEVSKNTLNSKVNNWAIEISPFRITFEYIKGIKNTLADTMSRLIDIDPDMEQLPEEDGHEFGYYAFDILPPIEISAIEDEDNEQNITNVPVDINKLENLIQLQLDNPFCSKIFKPLTKGNLIETTLFHRRLYFT